MGGGGYTTQRSTVATATSSIGTATQRRGAGWGGTTFEAFLIHDDGVVLRRLRQAEELTSEWDKNRRGEGRSDSRPDEGRKHLKVPHGAKFNLPVFSVLSTK